MLRLATTCWVTSQEGKGHLGTVQPARGTTSRAPESIGWSQDRWSWGRQPVRKSDPGHGARYWPQGKLSNSPYFSLFGISRSAH